MIDETGNLSTRAYIDCNENRLWHSGQSFDQRKALIFKAFLLKLFY